MDVPRGGKGAEDILGRGHPPRSNNNPGYAGRLVIVNLFQEIIMKPCPSQSNRKSDPKGEMGKEVFAF